MTDLKIIEQQKTYLSYLPKIREKYGKITGVDLIGLGAKERSGEITSEWAFRFYVKKKLPLENLTPDDRIPSEIMGLQTDVITHFEKESLVCDASAITVDNNKYRDDGLRGGISIRNEHFDNDQPSGYGTLGILARRTSDNALVGLSCAHVVNAASDSNTALNTKIGQPKYYISCCCCPYGYIGDVVTATFTNDLDCAIIEIHEDLLDKITTNSTENKVEGITGDITGAAAIICFDNLEKRGRSTAKTVAEVVDIAYGTNHMLVQRTDGVAGDPFACYGDSGSVIVNSAKQVVGLLVAAAKSDMKKGIVTHIKPVMENLGISIAGTVAADIGQPVGGGTAGCELFAWPGGHADTSLNPVEVFNSSDFGFSGNIDWDVSEGASGAVIVETGTQTASGLSSISVRYDNTSSSKNAPDAVWVKAISGSEEATKFRTVFTLTPRTVNTVGTLDTDNTKRFPASGGTDNQAGIAVPGTDGATAYMVKAEIAFDILPSDIQWSGSGGINFMPGAVPSTKGMIASRRETKFTSGEQANGDTNRSHTDQTDWISEGDSTPDEYQVPTDAAPNEVFRLAVHEIDPTNLLQVYLRADYRDYLEMYNGANWVRITSYAQWHANLTGEFSGGSPPPDVGGTNNLNTGVNTENIPNQPPTITVNELQEVKPGESVTLSATPVDPDNDEVTVNWAQTAGPAMTLSAATGNTVSFTAPANDPQLKFTATADDGTGTLSRTAGNNQSSPAEATVNVIEWKNIGGGDPIPDRNMTEIFNAADFGIGPGALNWDVTQGGTSAIIIEADGVTIGPTGTHNGATTIKVRYDNTSGDLTRAQSVKIQATHPGNGKVWFKRRTVFLVTLNVHPTDGHTHYEPSMLVTGKDHFVSAQGQGNSVFTATINPIPPSDIVTWNAGATAITSPAVGGSTSTCRISSNTGTGQRIPFKLRINGDDVYEGIYWTVWGSFASTSRAISSVVSADRITTSGGYDFTFTIQPASIIPAVGTTADVPDLSGNKTVDPPDVPAGDVSVYQKGTDLSGGASLKWDTTRRAKQKVLNPDGVTWDPGTRADFRTTFNNYPSSDIVGNDDTHVGEPEDNNPYTNPGHRVLTGLDTPTDGLKHSIGSNGDTVEIRFHCQEFARLEIGGNWYQISPDYSWKIHWLWIKNAGRWADNGCILELNNNGF